VANTVLYVYQNLYVSLTDFYFMVFKIILPQPMSKKMQKKENITRKSNTHKNAQKNTKSQNKIAHLLCGEIESILRKNRIFRFLSNTCDVYSSTQGYRGSMGARDRVGLCSLLT
jgi:hypothetical protein